MERTLPGFSLPVRYDEKTLSPQTEEPPVEAPLKHMDPAKARRVSVALVFACTVIGAAAQMLMKAGVSAQPHDSALGMLMAIFRTPTLFAGFSLYGLSAALLVVALKYGELSILYPVIALTYVWVTALSLVVYDETFNALKLIGLTAVVLGVAVLGRSGRK
jgi:drug/metabolite transporter (DMT)-like permease